MLKENNKTQEELEKEIAALEQSIQVAKESNLDKLVIDVLEETKSNFERELSGFLRIKEVVSDDEIKDYYLLKDGVEIHLNAFVEDKICEELVIYNNDLVFIQIENWVGSILSGIFSFNQKRIIFPFIINDFDFKKDDLIYLELEENWSDDHYEDLYVLNESNDFAYLFKTGEIFQNEGHPIFQLNKLYYVLADRNFEGKMLFGPSDSDERVAIYGIEDYSFFEEWGLFYFEKREKSGIFNISELSLIFECEGHFRMDSELSSCNFFVFHNRNFHQIFNRKGKLIFQYSRHAGIGGNVMLNKEVKARIEYYVEGTFYSSFEEDVSINDDYISMRAFDYQSNRNVVIYISEEDFKIIDVDLYHLELQFEKLQDKRFSQDEYVMSIDDYRKKGVRFELFSFFDNSDFEKYFDDKCFSSIQKELDNLSEFEKLSRNGNLNERLVGLLNSITRHQQFVDGKLFQVGKGGVINHLMIGF